MNPQRDEIHRHLARAEEVVPAKEVERALQRMATAITQRLRHADPLVLVVMNGGLIPAGMLLPRLDFPLRLDYLHATRYRERTFGTELQWKKRPEEDLAERTVLVVDDILDEGHTLQAIVAWCREQGAREVLSAVLVEKIHHRGCGMQADFVGLQAPDRYLFGCGMDYRGWGRNLPGIHAIREEDLNE
jgi:hypoxanthine phosphoribosyltransferase